MGFCTSKCNNDQVFAHVPQSGVIVTSPFINYSKYVYDPEEEEYEQEYDQNININIINYLNGIKSEVKIQKISNITSCSELKAFIYLCLTQELAPNHMNLYFKGNLIQPDRFLSTFSHDPKKQMEIQIKKIFLSQIQSSTVILNNKYPESSQEVMPCKCRYRIERDQMVRHFKRIISENKYLILCPQCKGEWEFRICQKVGVFTKTQKQQFQSKLGENYIKQNYSNCNRCKLALQRGQIKGNARKCPQCQQDLQGTVFKSALRTVFNSRNPEPQISLRADPFKHPLCLYLKLKPELFDTKQDIEFKKVQKVLKRGGFPYYAPPLGKRYGLFVSGKFDKGNDDWLDQKSRSEWAVGYHGIRQPTIEALNSILSDLGHGNTLVQGERQIHCRQKPINKPAQIIGLGVYFSPHIEVCVKNYCKQSIQIDHQKYKIVLQCKINPKAIKICPTKQIYWVINDPKYIRPYGIIVIRQSEAANYPPSSDELFYWEKYKTQINNFLENMPQQF